MGLTVIPLGLLLTGIMLIGAVRSAGTDRAAGQRRKRLASHARPIGAIAVPGGSGMGRRGLALTLRASAVDERLARWLPASTALRDRLDRTGRTISLARYVGWMAVTAIVIGIGAAFVVRGVLGPLVLGVVVGVLLPHLLTRRMARRRLAAFTAQFPNAIDLIVRALRAGLPLSEALVTIAQECADPIGCEFRRAVGALAIGRSIEAALWDIERTVDSAELRFFIISISVQVQTGGNLGETLGNLADILRQRSQMRMKVKAMTGEARASAMVLGSLPFVIALLMSFTNPNYIAPLFTDPRGWIMLGGGGLMLSIGLGIMAKLVSFEI